MRHRIKKIPSLISNFRLHSKTLRRNHHLLHSDKSTYFYNSKLGNSLGVEPASYSANEFLERSRHHDLANSTSEPARVNPTRARRQTNSYSRITSRARLSSIPLILSSGALLLVLGLMIFPTIDNEVMALGSGVGQDNDYGIDTQAELNLSLGLSGNSIGSNEDGSAPAVVGKPSYGGVTLTATATDINPLTGYSIYVQTTGADTRLKNNIDDSNVIDTITEEAGVTGENIPLNQWGYAIERLESADQQVSYPTMTFKGVSPSGDTSATAAHGKENLNNAKFALAFGANIGSDKLAGHYRTDVLVSLVAEAKTMVTYSLSYDGNGNTSGTAPNTATVESREDSYEFTVVGKGSLEKTNAEFLGWATTADATEAEYTEGSKLKLTRLSDEAESISSQTLYAVWKMTSTPTTPVTNWADLQYMQQMSSAACESASVNDTKQLIDTRDNKSYWVTKLNDGNCWMTQNLDLDLYVDGANRTLTPEDSNVSENWTSTTGPSTVSGYSSSNGYYVAQYYDPGDKYCNTSNCNATTTSNDGHDHQGNFYSWTAATAGAGTSSVTSGNVSSSICPKGWQLPLSNSGTNPKTFQALTNTLGATSGTSTGSSDSKLLTSPAYFIRSGYILNGSLNLAGSLGNYWSSTASSSYNAYSLYFISSSVSPSYNYYRYYGYSVRCVAR